MLNKVSLFSHVRVWKTESRGRPVIYFESMFMIKAICQTNTCFFLSFYTIWSLMFLFNMCYYFRVSLRHMEPEVLLLEGNKSKVKVEKSA